MEYVKEWIIEPLYHIMTYPITIFGFTFNLIAPIIFSFMLGLLVTIIRFFIGGKD